MRLTIVIPALNEEAAIADIIERTLAARSHICQASPVRQVDIIVVSDGSTDGTAEIAGRYAGREDVRLIVFEHNRGYGAAIKAGFALGEGELVGFLDADGTCEPRFFADLCRALVEDEAHIAIGARLHRDSHMPRVRRLGNRAYAVILGLISNRAVTDTASGMRVIRRDVLARLYPLPDRLDFTPAMSARALMDHALSITERAMPYRERVGRSKLSVLRDGIRFLQTIGHMALVWNPERVFISVAMVGLAVMTLLALHPLEQWVRAGRFGEDAIYRLLFCMWLGCTGGVLLSAGALMREIGPWLRANGPDSLEGVGNRLAIKPKPTYLGGLMDRLYSLTGASALAAMSLPLLGWLVGPGLWSRLTEGHITLHWSRVVLAGLIAFLNLQLVVAALVTNIVRFHRARGLAEKSFDSAALFERTMPILEVSTSASPDPAPADAALAGSAKR